MKIQLVGGIYSMFAYKEINKCEKWHSICFLLLNILHWNSKQKIAIWKLQTRTQHAIVLVNVVLHWLLSYEPVQTCSHHYSSQIGKRLRKTYGQQDQSLQPGAACGLWPPCFVGYWCHTVSVTCNPDGDFYCFSVPHSVAPSLDILFGICLTHFICLPSLSFLHWMLLLTWCPATTYHPQASRPAEQSWRECGFSVTGLAGIQGLVASYLQFHLIKKRADGVAGETAWEIYMLEVYIWLSLSAQCIGLQATGFIHGYMTLWITNRRHSVDKIDNIFIIWSTVKNGMVLISLQ